MRTNIARCVFMTLTAVVLSGCYSDGHWRMPWTSTSPFQSNSQTAPVATPGTVGTPTKPAGVAAGTTNTATPPSSGYGTTGSGTTVPPVTSTGAPSSYSSPGSGYPPYSSPSSSASSSTPSGYGPAYTASAAGQPGYGSSPSSYNGASGSYGSPSSTSAPPYGTTNPYSNSTPSPSYGQVPARRRMAAVRARHPTARLPAHLRMAVVRAHLRMAVVRAHLRIAVVRAHRPMAAALPRTVLLAAHRVGSRRPAALRAAIRIRFALRRRIAARGRMAITPAAIAAARLAMAAARGRAPIVTAAAALPTGMAVLSAARPATPVRPMPPAAASGLRRRFRPALSPIPHRTVPVCRGPRRHRRLATATRRPAAIRQPWWAAATPCRASRRRPPAVAVMRRPPATVRPHRPRAARVMARRAANAYRAPERRCGSGQRRRQRCARLSTGRHQRLRATEHEHQQFGHDLGGADQPLGRQLGQFYVATTGSGM